MESEGYIQAEVIPQSGRPDKKCYHVTDLGHAHLQNWMVAESAIPAVKDDLLVKLYAGTLVQPEILVAEIKRHQGLHQDRLATYQTIAQTWFAQPEKLEASAYYRYLTLRCGIGYETHWLEWADAVLRSLATE